VLYPSDIDNRIRSHQGEIWLTMPAFDSIGIDANTVNKGVNRGLKIWQAIKDPADGRRNLIKFSSLHPSYKEAIKAEICGGLEPDEWLVMQAEQAKQDAGLGRQAALIQNVIDVCEEDYRRYLHLYRDTEPAQQRVLSRAAGVIEVLAAWYKANGIKWKSYEPVNQVADWIKQHEREFFYKKYLPLNPIKLKEKVLAYAVEGVQLNEVIALPRSGNENRATKKKEMWWQVYAIELRKDSKNFTQAQIVRKLRDLAPIMGKDVPSETTVRAFLGSKEHLTVALHTDLNNKRGQRHRASLPSAGPKEVDVCWQMDGTKVQFAGHLTGNKTKDGRKETKSLSIVAVRDVHSGAFIGYWYGYGEDENAYRCALKMAVDITGKLPYELRYDQFPGSTSPSWKYMEGTKEEPGALERAGVKLTKTSLVTGKAHLERGWYTLQQVFEAEKKEFIGLGIKAGIAHARPTELYIARMQREFLNKGWNFDNAWMSHAQVIATYNHTVVSTYSRKRPDLHATPWQVYENGQVDSKGFNPDAIGISELFWESREEGIRKNVITFRFKKDDYEYKISAKEFDLLEYQRKGIKVVVKFDPADMSEVMIFNKKGEYLTNLKEQSLIPTFGPDADWKAVNEWKENQAEIKKIKKAKLDEYALTEEVASALATLVPKTVHNDALENYAMNNAGRWKIEGKPKKAVQLIETEDFDAEEFARAQF
jgi:hypothetical protein